MFGAGALGGGAPPPPPLGFPPLPPGGPPPPPGTVLLKALCRLCNTSADVAPVGAVVVVEVDIEDMAGACEVVCVVVAVAVWVAIVRSWT